MTKFDELKTRFPNLIPVPELRANVSIAELAVQYGYEHLAHKGQSRPVLKHPDGDTIIIKNPSDPAQQLYQRAGDFTDSGTVIDFIRNRLPTVFSTFNRPGQHEFRNITNVLYDYLRIDPNQVARNREVITSTAGSNPKQPFAKEFLDIRPLEADNYLLKRHIAQQVIESPEFKGKAITQVSYLNPTTGRTEDFLTVKEHPERKYLTFHNVAFPYYNGLSAEITGFELRNENLKQHAPGSDRYSSVFLSNMPPKPQTFIVLESVLDAMAHKQLRMIKGDEAFNSVYFSTGGQLTGEQVNTVSRYISAIDRAPDWKIQLSFDNDAKGHRYDLQFVQQLTASHFPMTPAVAGGNRVGYLLPEGEKYAPLRNALLERVELYNNNVRIDIEQPAGDELSKKELSNQLINIAQKDGQLALHIPEASTAMNAVSVTLLELTGLKSRIGIEKSYCKDFCDELKTQVDLGKRFTYAITDETGKPLYNSNSAVTIQRTMIHLQNQYTDEGGTKAFRIVERQPDGWLKPQATLTLKEGQVVSASEQPEFRKAVLEEKSSRSQQVNQTRQEKGVDSSTQEDSPKRPAQKLRP